MSSIARVNMILIATKNLLPQTEMVKVFNDCLNEINGKILNNSLVINSVTIGRILIGDRIVVQTTSSQSTVLKQTEELRNLFSRRSEVAYRNYQDLLLDKEMETRRNITNQIELNKHIDAIQSEKNSSAIAYVRQQKDNCVALKEELIEEAEKQGYDVIDNSTEVIQLQFVKRVY